ncbi:hypothetical protein ACHAXS_012908 [Conticribra weissflogii]
MTSRPTSTNLSHAGEEIGKIISITETILTEAFDDKVTILDHQLIGWVSMIQANIKNFRYIMSESDQSLREVDQSCVEEIGAILSIAQTILTNSIDDKVTIPDNELIGWVSIIQLKAEKIRNILSFTREFVQSCVGDTPPPLTIACPHSGYSQQMCGRFECSTRNEIFRNSQFSTAESDTVHRRQKKPRGHYGASIAQRNDRVTQEGPGRGGMMSSAALILNEDESEDYSASEVPERQTGHDTNLRVEEPMVRTEPNRLFLNQRPIFAPKKFVSLRLDYDGGNVAEKVYERCCKGYEILMKLKLDIAKALPLYPTMKSKLKRDDFLIPLIKEMKTKGDFLCPYTLKEMRDQTITENVKTLVTCLPKTKAKFDEFEKKVGQIRYGIDVKKIFWAITMMT